MNIDELIRGGENSAVEFKTADVRSESLAKEFVALEELARLFQQADLVHFDISPVPQLLERDLNQTALESYWDNYYDLNWSRLTAAERTRVLINSDILTAEGAVTVGGALLFASNPQRALPHASVIFAVFAGKDKTTDLVDKKEITGTLDHQVDATLGLLKLYLRRGSKIEGAVRVEEELIPEKVLREALVNALVHRDYSIQNQKTSVYFFEDRIEITNPGALPNTLTLEKLRYGHSAPRNMFLLKYMDNYRYIDGLGRGIPTMVAAMGERITGRSRCCL